MHSFISNFILLLHQCEFFKKDENRTFKIIQVKLNWLRAPLIGSVFVYNFVALNTSFIDWLVRKFLSEFLINDQIRLRGLD